MLTWALIFFILALVSGALGFTNLAGAFGLVAKVLFMVFLILFIVALIMGLAIL